MAAEIRITLTEDSARPPANAPASSPGAPPPPPVAPPVIQREPAPSPFPETPTTRVSSAPTPPANAPVAPEPVKPVAPNDDGTDIATGRFPPPNPTAPIPAPMPGGIGPNVPWAGKTRQVLGPAPEPAPKAEPEPAPTPEPKDYKSEPVTQAGPNPTGIPSGHSNVPAFDRPQAVVVMGPNPLPVTVVGGMAGDGAKKPAEPKPPPNTEQRVQRYTNMAATGAQRAGNAIAGAARGTAVPALGAAVDVAAMGLSKLGPAGIVAAGAVKIFGEAVVAVKQTVDALVARGRELAPYSGTLAASTARADVRKLQSDVGEAERIGPALAKLIDAQSRAEAMQQRMLEPIKSFLADKLTVLMEGLMQTAVGILEGVEQVAGGDPELRRLIADMKKLMEGGGDPLELIDRWTRGVGGLAAPRPAGAPAGGAGAGLGIPAV